LRWMAPELIGGITRRNASTSSDIYSFGCVVHFVAVGKSPAQQLAKSEIIKLAKTGTPVALN